MRPAPKRGYLTSLCPKAYGLVQLSHGGCARFEKMLHEVAFLDLGHALQTDGEHWGLGVTN